MSHDSPSERPLPLKIRIVCMTSEELGDMFEGNFADRCHEKFPLMLKGDKHPSSVLRRGERTPIGASRFKKNSLLMQ